MSEPSDREILWRDYALNAQLYQFYMDAVVKAATFYYGITGAIISFCLTRPKTDFTRWALVFPLLMSICLAILFTYSSFLAKYLREDTEKLANQLGLNTSHEYSPLMFILRIFAVILLICAVGIGYLLWKLST